MDQFLASFWTVLDDFLKGISHYFSSSFCDSILDVIFQLFSDMLYLFCLGEPLATRILLDESDGFRTYAFFENDVFVHGNLYRNI